MEERRRWELSAAWLLGALLCLQVSGMLLRREETLPSASLWAGLAAQGVWVCTAVGVAALLRGPIPCRLGLGPGRIGPVALAVLTLGLLALSDGLSAFLSLLQLRETGALGEVQRQAAASEGPSFLLMLVGFGLAPGIAEELLFRGLVQRACVSRLGRWPGITLAAALFGAAHADPVQSPAAFCLGLYLGVIADLAGSTRAPMLCHVVNNLLAAAGARFGGPVVPVSPAVAAPVLVALAVGLLVAVWRREARRRVPLGPLGGEPGES